MRLQFGEDSEGAEESEDRVWARLEFRPPTGEVSRGPRFRWRPPVTPMVSEALGWYLETWALWPSPYLRPRAEAIEEELVAWGTELWKALEPAVHRDLLAAWYGARKHGWQRRLSVEVRERFASTSSAQGADPRHANQLLALPWELLHDGSAFLLQGPDAVAIRRSRGFGTRSETEWVEAPIRILLVSPRPIDEQTGYFDHRAAALPLVEAVAPLGASVALDLLDSPTFPAMAEALEQASRQGAPYHILHFDGHGVFEASVGGMLLFEHAIDDDELWWRMPAPVDSSDLAELLRIHRVPLVFLEACRSGHGDERPEASIATRLLQGGVSSVVAMTHNVLVETTRRFVAVFYRQLVAGQSIGGAVLAGQRELARERHRRPTFAGDLELDDWFVPVLFQQRDDPRLMARVELEPSPRLPDEDFPAAPAHGFWGRSRELLALERLLLRQPYAVVLGEGGEGKTTLACELARWLVTTRRAARAVFVSVEIHRTPGTVIDALGAQLVEGFAALAATHRETAWRALERSLSTTKTVIVVDNCESLLALEPENESLGRTLQDLARCLKFGRTRLVLTSRSALPEPFADHAIELGRLASAAAIRLVHRVLMATDRQPESRDAGRLDEIETLTETVGRHARSLVLLAGEIAARGVRAATVDLEALMVSLAERYPDERERSLFASVELSLRRLPPTLRQRLAPLAVFHGGAHRFQIGFVLDRTRDATEEVVQELIAVGLGHEGGAGYVGFHPALAPYLRLGLSDAELDFARERWVETVLHMAAQLYRQQMKHAAMAAHLTLQDLPNLLACLDLVLDSAEPWIVVELADCLERLLSGLGLRHALARVVRAREVAAQRLGSWSHARYLHEVGTITRRLEDGRIAEALERAESLVRQLDSTEETFPEIAFDRADARFHLAEVLQEAGQPQPAIELLEGARSDFEKLAAEGDAQAGRSVSICTAALANCAISLGQFERAVEQFEVAIEQAEAISDSRQAAACRAALASARLEQGRFVEALVVLRQAERAFLELNDPRAVANILDQTGQAHHMAGDLDAAENNYSRSLVIKARIGHRRGEAHTLVQLGNLMDYRGSIETSIQYYRRAAELYEALPDRLNEGRSRINLADGLRKLGDLDGARRELEVARAHHAEFGDLGEPWKHLAALASIEADSGHPVKAEESLRLAKEAYLSYRRNGGETKFPGGRLCHVVLQSLISGTIDRESEALAQLAATSDLPTHLSVLIPVLEAVLAGNRNPELAADPALFYADAVELLLLFDALARIAHQTP
ncbi:MAG: CHAT domain-containing protein [Myxococcota bacterium]